MNTLPMLLQRAIAQFSFMHMLIDLLTYKYSLREDADSAISSFLHVYDIVTFILHGE